MARVIYAPTYRKTPPGAIASYAPASEGPFRCDHCEYQLALNCHKPEVLSEARLLRQLPTTARTVTVEADACCNFFERSADA